MTKVAAIDCGTNSLRLLVAELGEDGILRDLDRRTTIVRLGEGVDRTGQFSAAALARTFDTVDDYASVLKSYEIAKIRFVATSASRDVSNRAEFEAGIISRLGVAPDVISGEEEARLSFLGATGELQREVPGPFLVIDIGGGSTEFVLGTEQPTHAESVNIGCVRMTERHFESDPPSVAEIAAATIDIDAAIEAAAAVVPMAEATTVIGLAGTVTTVAAMALGLDRYDRDAIHGSVLSDDQVRRSCERLLHMSRQQRGALPYMHPGRVDVIGAGSLVLDRIMAFLPQTHLRVSEHDILDGIAADLLN